MATETIQGHGISPGVTEGTLHLLRAAAHPTEAPSSRPSGPPAFEISRFNEHLTALVADLRDTAIRLEEEDEPEAAGILNTHILILEDVSLRKRVEETIRRDRVSADVAVDMAMAATASALQHSHNPIMAERAADLTELSIQLRGRLAGGCASFLPELEQDPSECVFAIAEIFPSLVLEARDCGARGFIVEKGTPLSHAAILASSFGIPVIRLSHLGPLAQRVGEHVIVDAVRGELVIRPGETEFASRRSPNIAEPSEAARAGDVRAHVWLTIMDPEQLRGVDWDRAEGVGLYRTETLFMRGPNELPTEAEQVRAYRRLFALCPDRPVTVRTLDIGGDKRLPYFSLGPQENPALGLRAHRIYRFHPEILITQVRAILRAAGGHPGLRLMFPMIECLEEWIFVQSLVDRALESLRDEHAGYSGHFERGVLLETPSAVWSFRSLLRVVDFASVGTNDLVQYLFAADRTNANVARRYRPEHPIVLGILRDLSSRARRAGKRLSLCGEIGSDPGFLPLLMGLGIDDLSVPVNRLRAVQSRLATLKLGECRDLARRCLAAETAEEVLAHMGWPGTPAAEPGSEHDELTSAMDPICHMAVFTEGNPLSAVRGGRRFFFCSRGCLDTFVRQQP